MSSVHDKETFLQRQVPYAEDVLQTGLIPRGGCECPPAGNPLLFVMLRSYDFKELKKNNMQGAKWEISSLPGCSASPSQGQPWSSCFRAGEAKGCNPG